MPYPLTPTQRETCTARVVFAYRDGKTIDHDIYPDLATATRNLPHYRPYGGHEARAEEIAPVCNHGHARGACAVAETVYTPGRYHGDRPVYSIASVCVHHAQAAL